MIKFGSLFDGAGTVPFAAAICGAEAVWASEIEPFPIAVTKKRFPNMKHLGDITKINGAEIEPVDVISFGSPCFPKGTMILTSKGYSPIEQIKIGDVVLTHTGKWQKVLDVGSKEGETIILKGRHFGLECTPNHPIYSAEVITHYRHNGREYEMPEKREWIAAEDMLGRYWATPNFAERLPIPIPERETAKQKPMPEMNEDFWYFIGRYLGDGWLRDGQRSNRPEGQTSGHIYICDSFDKKDELLSAFKKVFENSSCFERRTGVCVRACSTLLCKWIKENFGSGARNKFIAPWVYGMCRQYRQALLKGILDSDGHELHRSENYRAWMVATVSATLALGVRMLAESLGYSTTIYRWQNKPTTTIEGRTVKQAPYNYNIRISECNRRTYFRDVLHSWYKVKSIETGGRTKVVYNMTVENDNSYIADGIVVHNCQDLSMAGKRAGLEGERSGLFMEAVRIIKEMREKTNGRFPTVAIWENVPGAFSSNKGEDFRVVLEEMCRIKDSNANVPRPSCGGGESTWTDAGSILADGYSVAWRVLDAQYWGVPQRRRRIFLVADFAGQRAEEILFESDGLQRSFAESRKSWQGITDNLEGSIRTSGAGLSFDGYGGAISEESPTLGVNCGMSTGRNGVMLSAGFLDRNSADAKTIGFEEETSPTIRESVVPAAIAIENHAQDSRVKICEDGVVPTLNQQMGTGGVCTFAPSSGETAGTLDSHYYLGCGARGGKEREIIRERITYCTTHGSFHTKAEEEEEEEEEEEADTIQATDYKDPPIVNDMVETQYIVRRLTPTECGRLQGMPDWWCSDVEHSDAAEYKMWGNGMALPNILYVVENVVRVLKGE